MILHEDTEAFSELVSEAAQQIGLPQIYVEKDYWVTSALKNLSQSPFADSAVFKGGTSLSKAYKLIHRFSEDVDLAVLTGVITDNQRKQLLKKVEQSASTGLVAIDDPRVSKGSSFRRTVYQYPRSIDGDSFGQASPELLIEVNAFTRPEPFEVMPIQTLIADVLDSLGRTDLIELYDLKSFPVNVLSIKRTLVEKLLGVIKDSYHTDPVGRLSNRIRHLYDICKILQVDEYKNFLATEEFHSLCSACIADEQNGFFENAEHLQNPLKDAPIFHNFSAWQSELGSVYTGVFSELVYGDMPSIEDIGSVFDSIRIKVR